ncbi:hypothetical protein SDC9_138411 [bioreactor metagenome]|uniref:Uncharacterized protein n=1 Tax=bioreactor metagenome TaxID=1076179 RepID=A0A645DRE8_9ZZZZ
MKSKWPEIKEKIYLIERWCREGLTEKDIVSKLPVSMSTFEEYKKKYSELSGALKKNKEIADYQVEDSLYDKCLGKYVEEDRAFKCKEVYYNKTGKRCEREKVVVVKVQVYQPPDTMAMAIWLNNRNPDKWRRNANKERLDYEKFKHQKEQDEKDNW